MLERYTRPAMGQIWTLKNRYQAWLDVEIAATNAWAREGEVPREDAEKIAKNASFTVERVAELEEQTRHDVVAFTRTVSESLGDEKKWVHYGLTSTDVVDTANGVLLKQANQIIKDDLEKLAQTLSELAHKYKYTVTMGRTHGVHAEPTTFGLKLARWYSEVKRDQERFAHAAIQVEAGKISGAVGTFANVPPRVEQDIMEQLGLRAQEISTQVLPRDLHAEYVATLALIGTGIENYATEIRGLQRTEIHEVEEGFRAGQKGSSAMPHKRNPIGSENVTGLARILRGYIVPAYEDISLWHERDISHSSAERVILPDATELVDYILTRFTGILANLTVFPETMKENMEKTYGLIYSQRVLLKLIEAGMSREEAYDLVQSQAAIAWDERKSFKDLILNHPTIQAKIGQEELEDAFDYQYHLRYVDDIFERVFGSEK